MQSPAESPAPAAIEPVAAELVAAEPVAIEPADADAAKPVVAGVPVGKVAVRQRGGRRLFSLIALLVLLPAAAAAGWFAWSRMNARPARRADLGVAAVPVVPPPPVELVLETPLDEPAAAAGAAGLGARLERVSALAAEMAAAAARPAESVIVLPGRQAKSQSDSDVRHERWEIRLPPDVTLESYARQLDFFGIELGILGGTDEVTYLSHLADPQPTVRTGVASREARLYLTWQRGGLAEADRKIAAHAKIDCSGKLIAMFCPPRVEKELTELEQAAAKSKKIGVVQKTVFGIVPDGQGYKFHVIGQQAGGEAGGKPD